MNVAVICVIISVFYLVCIVYYNKSIMIKNLNCINRYNLQLYNSHYLQSEFLNYWIK